MEKDRLEQIITEAKNGDKSAFAELYSEYHDRLFFFVMKNVGRKDMAEDIVQETFLRSMERISDLRDPSAYSAWLHSTAYRLCLDCFKDEKHKALFDTEEEMSAALDNVSLDEPFGLPEDYAVNEELKSELKRVIDSLKPDVRAAVILYYYDDRPLSEVAHTLGINENAASQKLHRARAKLAKELEKFRSKGGMLMAAPFGVFMRDIIPQQQAGAWKSGVSAVSRVSFPKAAAAAAAVAAAVGIPLWLIFDQNNGIMGDIRNGSSIIDTVSVNEYITDTDTDSDSTAESESLPDTSSESESGITVMYSGQRQNIALPDSAVEDLINALADISEDTAGSAPDEALLSECSQSGLLITAEFDEPKMISVGGKNTECTSITAGRRGFGEDCFISVNGGGMMPLPYETVKNVLTLCLKSGSMDIARSFASKAESAISEMDALFGFTFDEGTAEWQGGTDTNYTFVWDDTDRKQRTVRELLDHTVYVMLTAEYDDALADNLGRGITLTTQKDESGRLKVTYCRVGEYVYTP